MKSIETYFIGPTNTKGSRIVATDCGDHRVTVQTNHAFSDGRNHDEAMRALCAKLGWSGEFIRGGTKRGYVYVWSTDDVVNV